METKRRVRQTGGKPPYWVITRNEEAPVRRGARSNAYRDLLTLEAGDSKVLPLFGSADQASAFAEAFESCTRQTGWRVTQAWAGELLMLLSAGGSEVGPCAGVDAVTFDPPEDLIEGEHQNLQTLGKRCFMDRLLGRGDRWWRGR